MDSQKLLRNLLEAALAADLEKNELRLFLALLNQTIGYGKAADPLTMGRLAQLTGIRKDRIGRAVSGVIEKGLFGRKPHSWLGFTYAIPSQFFEGEVERRFFAPSVPLGGKTSPPVVNENHSAVTYRDTPLQSSNLNSTNKGDEGLTLGDAGVCVVADSLVEKNKAPEKPESVDTQAYQKLLPALQTLSEQQAAGVLQLLALSVVEGSIRTSQERMGGGLIKAARQGTLDLSRLEVQQEAVQRQQAVAQAEAQRLARERSQERLHFERLARMAGVQVETLLGVRDE